MFAIMAARTAVFGSAGTTAFACCCCAGGGMGVGGSVGGRDGDSYSLG